MIKGCCQEEEAPDWKETLRNDLDKIKREYHCLKKEFDLGNELMEATKERYCSLERELQLLKEERDSLLKEVAESSQKLALITDQKENVLKDLNSQVQRRKDLEEEIKQFSVAFGCRQKSLVSFHNELKSNIEKLRAQNPVQVPKTLGG